MKNKLFKVPLKARLKDALDSIGKYKIKVGQLKSYIDELEYDNSKLRKRIKILTLDNKDVSREIAEYKKSLIHRETLNQIRALEEKNKKYKKNYDRLFHKYTMLQQNKNKVIKLDEIK